MTRLGKTSVDESLFGTGTKKPKSRQSVTSRQEPVVLTNDELLRIKLQAFNVNDGGNRSQDEQLKAEKAAARKEKIKQLQAMSLLKEQKTAASDEIAAREKAIRDTAQIKIDSNSDVVKTLSAISATAAAFTLREKQLQEKHARELQEKEYEKRMDMMMEIDRLRDLKRREDEEKYKLIKRHEDRQVITDQIEQRKRMQALAIEAREQENQSMRQVIQKYKDEDESIAQRRRQEIERSRVEVVKANEAAIQKKLQMKEEARREIEEMLAYQRQRDEALKKREDEEAAIERAKVARQAQLLAEQERVMNTQDKRDELLARRFAEEKARKEREQEKAKRMKQLDEARMLMASRERAAHEKRSRAEIQKAVELQEVQRVKEIETRVNEQDRRERELKKRAALDHRDAVLRQAQEAEQRRLQARQEKFAEGEALRIQEQLELQKYEKIRQKMVHDLEIQGVDPLFLSEMRAVNIQKILKKS